MMTINLRLKLAASTAIFLWGSAFAAIRVGLHHFTPQGLALWRYLIASMCMFVVYFRLPSRSSISASHKILLLLLGALGIGVYNLALNTGEITTPAAVASFITGQVPMLSLLLAIAFLGERLTLYRTIGFMISVSGIVVIAYAGQVSFHLQSGLIYLFIAAFAGALYSTFQKPFLKHYESIETTAWLIWGGTLFLMIYLPSSWHEMKFASLSSWLVVAYLGVFPAALGYLLWSYLLKQIPASQAVSYLYFQPLVAMLLGWLWLSETLSLLAVFGGVLATLGVFFINRKKENPEPHAPVAVTVS